MLWRNDGYRAGLAVTLSVAAGWASLTGLSRAARTPASTSRDALTARARRPGLQRRLTVTPPPPLWSGQRNPAGRSPPVGGVYLLVVVLRLVGLLVDVPRSVVLRFAVPRCAVVRLVVLR